MKTCLPLAVLLSSLTLGACASLAPSTVEEEPVLPVSDPRIVERDLTAPAYTQPQRRMRGGGGGRSVVIKHKRWRSQHLTGR
jgi:hypothetical protein